MRRETPGMLADEMMSAVRTSWMLSAARLRPPLADGVRLRPAIEIVGPDVRSYVELPTEQSAARAAAAALRRSGYEILGPRSQPSFARRPLRGARETEAEARRLATLAAEASALGSFPSRQPARPVRPRSAPTPLDGALLRRLRRRLGVSPEWVQACRFGPPPFEHPPGWRLAAFCWLFDDGEDRLFKMTVMLSNPQTEKVDARALARLTRALGTQLRPLGYERLRIQWKKEPPRLAIFEMDLRTLAGARRERRALDRALFEGPGGGASG